MPKPPNRPISSPPQSPPSVLGTVQSLEHLAEKVLSLAPSARLKRIWGPFQYIWADIQREQTNAGQLRALVHSIAQLLWILYEQDRQGNLKNSNPAPLEDLHGLVIELSLALTSDIIHSVQSSRRNRPLLVQIAG